MPGLQLEALEARVLGVLIEKELTTPEQYPLSLNAVVAGCNQKNNRDPLLSVGDAAVNDAILKLRVAGLVDFVQLTGMRVEKYRHKAGAQLHLQPAEVAVLAELMLRGAQQPGELRSRVERMHPMPDLPALQAVLDTMAGKGLVVRHERVPGERANRYAQTLCPAQGAVGGAAEASASAGTGASRAPGVLHGEQAVGGHESRIAALEAEVASLREQVRMLATKAGDPSGRD